jgi:type IV pilus assembly protein PilW
MVFSRSSRARAARCFTLIELLVGTVTTAIILTAVAAAFVGVQGSYQTEARIKVAVEGMRTATSFIEQRLHLASYGVEPRFAFDFATASLPSGTKSNYHVVLGNGLPDSITDDLAFRYRDAAWMRRGRFSGGIQLETGTFGMDFPAGQRFIVSCGRSKDYVVVKSTAAAARNASSVSGTVDAALSSTTDASGCLSKVGEQAPYVMLLHEMRLRIMDMDGRPFLVAFPSLDSLDMSTAVPLAADVESFQVAYVMNRPSPASAHASLTAVDSSSPVKNWVLGDAGSVDQDRVPDPLVTPEPIYDTPYDDPARYNRHPGNIRAVRLSISVRSTSPEATRRRAFTRLDLEDSGEGMTSPDGFYRTNMSTTVSVPNMLSRSPFNPPVGGEDPAGNVWGG